MINIVRAIIIGFGLISPAHASLLEVQASNGLPRALYPTSQYPATDINFGIERSLLPTTLWGSELFMRIYGSPSGLVRGSYDYSIENSHGMFEGREVIGQSFLQFFSGRGFLYTDVRVGFDNAGLVSGLSLFSLDDPCDYSATFSGSGSGRASLFCYTGVSIGSTSVAKLKVTGIPLPASALSLASALLVMVGLMGVARRRISTF